LPLGALAAGFGLSLSAWAQTTDPTPPERALPIVKAKAAKEPQGKDGVQATETQIGKGKQELRDIPQSVTVVTEKLMDDRNLDTLRDVLKATSGISFLAAEGGEEDIRLRGFALQTTGDVFVDGMRDPAFYERDTFNFDRVEVLRGSASMLFGRGSTGGAVNQVNKLPRLIDENEVAVTVGSHRQVRAVGDFNRALGDNSALRVATMVTKADSNGAGSAIDKQGLAVAWRTGIGERDEFLVNLTHLENRNGIHYGLPWARPTASAPVSNTTVLPLDPNAYYGLSSDRNHGSATQATVTHTHRFSPKVELVSKLRRGWYDRDLRASTVRFAPAAQQPGGVAATLASFGPDTVFTRGTQLKVQALDTTYVQSDLNAEFQAWGLKHSLQAGVDTAFEQRDVFAARSAAQGGINLVKPNTTVGAPALSAVDEDRRVLRLANQYRSQAGGVYVQDLVQLTPTFKALLGTRYDRLTGDYDTLAIPSNAAGPDSKTSYRMRVGEWSHRAGLLFQPNERLSVHLSGATSFNTSGDAYSLSAANVDLPPEQAINLEAGAKIDSEDGRFSTRLAVFRSTKIHERNTDPLVNIVTLSGRRHTIGWELDFAGKLGPNWELFASFMALPVAKIDVSSATGGELQGQRPSLTPKYSGSLWTTYQLTPQLRVGGGLTVRGAQTPIRNPGWSVPGFVVGDLMAEYQLIRDALVFKLNVSNVTNRLYADALYSGHYVPGAGRLVQLTGTVKF
jgi:catecholate siderophore receptor